MIILFCVCPAAFADNLVLHVGTLLAVPGKPPLKNQTIVISDNKITELADGFVNPAAGARLLDLKDQFVLPGLMDLHVHLLIELGPGSRSRTVTENETFTLLRGVNNARKTLYAGFTTVRDLGGSPESIYAIRDAIKTNLIPGPRVYAAGSSLAATGGMVTLMASAPI
ncbi:MAG: amidohydrolase family protein [bacterium]